MTPPDHERMALFQAALAGSALYGLYLFAALLAAGQTPTLRDYARAAVNMVCAVAAGGLMAWFLGPQLVHLIPWPSMREPTAVGFIIGAVGWELIPVLLSVAKSRAKKLGGDQ